MFPNLRISLLIFLTFSLVIRGEEKSSLFDEVPLNGALVPSDLDYNSLPSETVETKVLLVPLEENHSKTKSQKNFEETVHSLFDEVPDQGAFNSVPGRNSKTRTTRDSLDFDITRVVPSSEFDVPYWDKRFLTPIVNSITSPQSPPPPSRFSVFGGYSNRGPPPFSQSPGNAYGPPPPPPRRFHHQHPPHHHGHYNNGWSKNSNNAIPTPTREDNVQNKTYQVSANSGGPTVIVYTHPKKEGTQSDSGYQTKSTTEAPAKNEIHYHYHINNEESKPKPPPYGRPGYPPRRRPHPANAYGPPPPQPPKTGPYPPSIASHKPSNTYHTDNVKLTYPSSDETDADDDFSERTFATPSKHLYPKSPSTSYEVPPSLNAPSSSSYHGQSYGPSGHKPPDTMYGPPTSPPAPQLPPLSDDAGADQYETTITLQTIPITRQVTELVQVPNVVHKISSNRPVQSPQQLPLQDDSYQPSSLYGPPAPPPARQSAQKPSRVNLQDGESSSRPFERHLSQILEASSTTPTQNSRDSLLQELLLNQARTPGFDLTLNDLELLSLLQGSRGGGGGGNVGSSVGILQPQSSRSIFGGLSSGGLRSILNPSQSSQGWGLGSGGGNDGLTSLREAFREQRLQQSLQDLRKQLREQNRDNHKERSSYRSLFTKGAMLLSALTLIPSIVNPMSAAAGLGSTATNIPNFMLPMSAAAGRRRRRSIEGTRPLQKCLEDLVATNSSISFQKWSKCVPSETKSGLDTKYPHENLCIQKEFCMSVLGKRKLGLGKAYSLLLENADNELWVKKAVNAAKMDNCEIFKCIQN